MELKRADRIGQHNTAFQKNRKRILSVGGRCAICGKMVDTSLKRPHPLAPEVDHIVPIAKGGHPSAMDNLQLTHSVCNRKKGSALAKGTEDKAEDVIKWSTNWLNYRG